MDLVVLLTTETILETSINQWYTLPNCFTIVSTPSRIPNGSNYKEPHQWNNLVEYSAMFTTR